MEFIELLKEKKISFEIRGNILIVYDDVNLSNSQIRKFPDYPIVFNGNVDLSHIQIKKFPKCSMVFYGNANLSHMQIKKFLNHPLIFCGCLNLSHTQIKKFPNCDRLFYGYLDISHTQIKELPDCIIKGYLDINGTSITKIPKNLEASRIYTSVKGELDIYIEKSGKIGLNSKEKSIEEWNKFFKERKSFDNNPDLSTEQYDIVEQDFKTAVKLIESWNS